MIDRLLRTLPGVFSNTDQSRIDATLPTPDKVFVYSFYESRNPDAFFGYLDAFLRRGAYSNNPKQQSSYFDVIQKFNRNETHLILLDGLEVMQEDGLRSSTLGHLYDNRLRSFISRISNGTIPGVHLLISTRYPLVNMLASRAEYYREIRVEELQEEAAIRLLRIRGVKGPTPTLTRLIHQYGRHALTLDLLGGFIAHYCDGDPGILRADPIPEAADITPKQKSNVELMAMAEQQQRFNRLAARYVTQFAENDPKLLRVIQRVCLFRTGVTFELFADLFVSGKRHLQSVSIISLTRRQLAAKLEILCDLRLLEKAELQESPYSQNGPTTEESKTIGTYSVHPAVRDGFLSEFSSSMRQLCHAAISTQLEFMMGESTTNNRFPTLRRTADLAEELIFHVLEASTLQDAWDCYQRVLGGYNHIGATLADPERGDRICRGLVRGAAPRASNLHDMFRDPDLLALFMNGWSLYLSDLGELDDAISCLLHALDAHDQVDDRSGATLVRRNLFTIYITRGLLNEAFALLPHRIRSQFPKHRTTVHFPTGNQLTAEIRKSYVSAGIVFSLDGRTNSAIKSYSIAVLKSDDASPTVGSTGIAHSRLLIRLGEIDEAETLVNSYDQISQDLTGRRQHADSAACDLVRADIARIKNDFPIARLLAGKALDWAIKQNAREIICWGHISEAKTLHDEISNEMQNRIVDEDFIDDIDDMLANLHTPLEIARECGFSILHAETQLWRAMLMTLQGHCELAIAHASQACFDGIPRDDDRRLPEIIAMSSPRCSSEWTVCDLLSIMAKSSALHAAQIRRGISIGGVNPRNTIETSIKSCMRYCDMAIAKMKSIRDPRITSVRQLRRSVQQNQYVDLLEQQGLLREAKEPPLALEQEPAIRSEVFLSYASKDKIWVERLKTVLTPSIRDGRLELWDDSRILPGENWRIEIDEALKRAKVAVLLVSAEFLASDFVSTVELPRILTAEEEEGLTVIWMLIGDCLWEDSPISRFHAASNPRRPLNSLLKHERETAMTRIGRHITASMS